MTENMAMPTGPISAIAHISQCIKCTSIECRGGKERQRASKEGARPAAFFRHRPPSRMT